MTRPRRAGGALECTRSSQLATHHARLLTCAGAIALLTLLGARAPAPAAASLPDAGGKCPPTCTTTVGIDLSIGIQGAGAVDWTESFVDTNRIIKGTCPAACHISFVAGQLEPGVTVALKASNGLAFDHWLDDGSTSPTTNVTSQRNCAPTCPPITRTAVFGTERTISVALTPDSLAGGSFSIVRDDGAQDSCGSSCPPGSYTVNTTHDVTITANPPAGTVATEMYCGTTTPTLGSVCKVSGASDQSVAFNFVGASDQPAIAVAASPGGSVTVADDLGDTAVCTSTCTVAVLPDSDVTLTPSSESGNAFFTWGGACSDTGSPTQIAPVCNLGRLAGSSTHSVTATFLSTQVKLGAQVLGTGRGSISTADGQLACPLTCGGTETYATQIVIAEVPLDNSVFTGWNVQDGTCAEGTLSATCTLTVSWNTAVAATFAAGNATLTAATTGSGSGTVSGTGALLCPGTCSVLYPYGSTVELRAIPAPGSVFVGWVGACTGTQTTCSVRLTGSATTQADFEERGGGGGSGQGGSGQGGSSQGGSSQGGSSQGGSSQGSHSVKTKLTRASFSIHWHGRLVRGSVKIGGTVSAPATLMLRLVRSNGKSVRGVSRRLVMPGAKSFKLALPISANLVPGRYYVALTGTSPAGKIAPGRRALSLTAHRGAHTARRQVV